MSISEILLYDVKRVSENKNQRPKKQSSSPSLVPIYIMVPAGRGRGLGYYIHTMRLYRSCLSITLSLECYRHLCISINDSIVTSIVGDEFARVLLVLTFFVRS